MRKVIGCIGYQILKMGFETSEDDIFKKAMISELPINSRKWRKYVQHLVRRP
jgi:hypothetical protein